MNLLVIILSLILFDGINTLDTDDVTGIDVLEKLKEKKISCDLHDFVTSVTNPENEYNALMDDLKKYCSESESTDLSRIVCHMILIELEIGCTLRNITRPSPVKYINSNTATQVCSVHKIALINKWIWEKLTAREKQQLGSSWVELCPKLTAFNTTLRLTRFFYKIAPRIKRAETQQHRISLLNKTSPGLVADKLKLVKEKLLENSKNTSGDEINQKYQQSINETRRKTKLKNQLPSVLDLKPQQSKSNITKIKTRRKQFLDNDDDAGDGIIIDSREFKEQQKKVDQGVRIKDDHKHEPADLKKVDDKEMKAANRLNNNGDIFPLGPRGEKPEREQLNERPKPRMLEIENVFKPNERESRNWVEGQHADNQEQRVNKYPFLQMKHEENPLNPPRKGKKKLLLRSRSNRYRDDDFDNWTNKFTTSSLIFFLLIVIIYLVLHNKNKIIGLLMEGCRRRRGIYGRRFSGLTRHSRLSLSS